MHNIPDEIGRVQGGMAIDMHSILGVLKYINPSEK